MLALLYTIFAFLAVAKGHAEVEITPNILQILAREYVNLTRPQHSKILADYSKQIEIFETRYSGRIEGVHIQEEIVTASIVQIEKRLSPLENLSDLGKQCVSKYRIYIPSVVHTKKNITRCAAAASVQVTKFLAKCIETRNILQNYFINDYEKHIERCSNSTSLENFTECVSRQTSKANSAATANQKKFDFYMESAHCAAKAYIMKALDCSYIVQTRVTTRIAETNLLLNNCLAVNDECSHCEANRTCPNSLRLPAKTLKYKTIANPFYGLDTNAGCVVVNIEKY